MNILQGNNAGDISLESLAVMAKAGDTDLSAPIPREESGGLGTPCRGGIQSTGKFENVARKCVDCTVHFGYNGIGWYGSC